jgi:peptidoglycan L-alanyl-D-glutamate endopeptidase CwlK
MSFRWGKKSNEILDECHPIFRTIFTKVLEKIDCKAFEGRRSKELQNQYYREGKSKLQWPHSKHNITLNRPISHAIHVLPYPIDFNNIRRIDHFAGVVRGIAWGHFGIDNLRWGGDWDRDYDNTDQQFHDLAHWELDDEAGLYLPK